MLSVNQAHLTEGYDDVTAEVTDHLMWATRSFVEALLTQPAGTNISR